MLRNLFLLTTVFAVIGCTGEPVTNDELVGIWVISDEWRRYLSEKVQNGVGSIELLLDQNFNAIEVPGSAVYGMESQEILVTGHGKWRLGIRDGRQELELEFHSFEAGQMSGTPFTTRFGISKSGSKPEMYFYNDDPDGAPRIMLEKK